MKINSGQAPSTLVPKYIGSDFDQVVTVGKNIEDVKTVAGAADDMEVVIDNLGSVATIVTNIGDVVNVSGNVDYVRDVAGAVEDVGVVADNLGSVTTVATNIGDVVSVSDNMDYVKDVAAGIAGLPVISYIGEEPPAQPEVGSSWYCTTDGRTYVWYKDIDSYQWVESSPQSAPLDLQDVREVAIANTERQIKLLGYDLVKGSFEEGALLSKSTDVVLYKHTGVVYKWKGVFPAQIAANSSPTGTGISNWEEVVVPVMGASVTEALRRSYAEAGYNLVNGSFEVGGTVAYANDVLLYEATGVAYAYSGTLPHTIGVAETPIGNHSWVPVNLTTRNLAINDIIPGTFSGNPIAAIVGDTLPAGCNFVRVNGAVYRCTPVAGGQITSITPRYIVAGGIKSYLSHISRHAAGMRKPMNWKLEFSVKDDDITADLKAEFGYTSMGFQGMYIDRYDGLVYIGWQTLTPSAVWVSVHDWVTGELVTRLHFPNNAGAPEGLHIARVSGQRYVMLPYSPNRTVRMYAIADPRTLADKTQITVFSESVDLGVRYQFSGWANTLLYENADQGWPKIFNVETGVSNIFNQLAITDLISGSYSPRGAITIDSKIVGRGAGKPKRQGIALGSQRIFAGVGASTTASAGWTFAGLQGYAEYSLDGTEIGQYLVTPADFKAYWDGYVGLNTYSTENEGIQSSDVSGVEEQYMLQSVRYLSPEGVNYRTLNIIRVNCPTNEPGTIDFGPLASSAAHLYNPRGRTVNAGRYPVNPADGIAEFTSIQAIAEYLRGTDIGTYIVYTEHARFMFEGGAGAVGQVTIPAFNHIRIDYVNGDTWNITVTGVNRANNYTGRISKNGGYNAFTKLNPRSISINGSAGLRDVAIQSPIGQTLPVFAGDWSTGVSGGTTDGVTPWQPAAATNGALWESGYAANRILQMFLSTNSKLYFRYVDDVARQGNVGWAEAWSTLNTTVDASGFIKKASPIVKIFSDGGSETNRESEGVTVTRLAVGEYLIEKCLGLNADTAWGGVDGGFEIPTDRNKQPLIWLDYAVNADGSILVKTYHRTHPAAPVFARNIIEGLVDGAPVDIPADQFVSVRVEMPEDSVWNTTLEQLEKADEITSPADLS